MSSQGYFENIQFQTIIDAVGNVQMLINFIENGGLYDSIKMIGDNSVSAALYALENKRFSQDPKTQVRSAANHLEEAHTAFRSIWKSRTTNKAKGIALQLSLHDALDKDEWVLSLMAACHLYLRDVPLAKKIVRVDIKEVRDARRRWHNSQGFDLQDIAGTLGYFTLGFLKPSESRLMFGDSEVPEIQNEEFAEFSRKVLSR
jgi:hypothetical protein